MPKPRAKESPTPVASDRYHHGSLVEALIAATIDIIEARGVEHVSVREVARRAGVSSGAPFRHFATKTALLTAVGEQAMDRLREAVDAAVTAIPGDKPLQRLRALGLAYLRWALQNPTHFQVISSRSLIDVTASDRIRGANAEIRDVMVRLLEGAQRDGTLAPDLDVGQIVLVTRALGYGLARMAVDGHFPEWHAFESPEDALPKAYDLFLALLAPKTAVAHTTAG